MTRSPPLLVGLLLLLGLSTLVRAQTMPPDLTRIDIARTPNIEHLARRVELLEDPSEVLNLATVLALPAERWQRNPYEVLNLGFRTAAWWVRFSLSNDSEQSRGVVFEVGWPLLDLLDVYLIRAGQVIESHITGDHRPFATRPLDSRNFDFPLEVPAGESREVFLRLALRDGVFDPVPLHLWEPTAYAAASLRMSLWTGAYFGALLALLLYNLLLFFSTRDRTFFFYAVYLSFLGLWNLGFLGYGHQYLWPDRPWWNSQVNLSLSWLAHVGAAVFVISYLDTRRRTPFLHRLILAIAAAMAVPVALELADSLDWRVPTAWVVNSYVVMSSILVLLFLGAGSVAVGQGFRPAGWFVLAWSFVVIGVLIYAFTSFPGVIPSNALTENSVNIGSALEFLLLALALGSRFNQLRDEKLAAERHAVELQVLHTEILEREVQERTRELREAMAKIEVLARTDELTQLLNRRAFDEIYAREFTRSRREGRGIAFCMLDVDHFKRYNDHYGHAAGDETLRQIAAVLRQSLRRPTDYAFRLGGEEFGVLLAAATDPAHAIRLIEQIRFRIFDLAIPHVESDTGVVTSSFGLACSHGSYDSFRESLYQAADLALYRAKELGRNRVEVSDAQGST